MKRTLPHPMCRCMIYNIKIVGGPLDGEVVMDVLQHRYAYAFRLKASDRWAGYVKCDAESATFVGVRNTEADILRMLGIS